MEANWVDPLIRRYGLKASLQYTDQRSVGKELVGDFSTSQFGLLLAGSRRGLVVKLAYMQTDEAGEIRSPWGGVPSQRLLMLCSNAKSIESDPTDLLVSLTPLIH